MKNILFSIAFVCVAFYAQAQKIVQNGQVRLQNSKYETGKTEYIGGVQIKFDGSVATTSDNAGKFSVLFLDKNVGDILSKERIYKEGYELVNEKELDFPNLTVKKADRLGTDIIMAKKGTLEIAKKQYYNISDKELLAGFERQKKDIEKKYKAAKISQAEVAKKYEELEKNYILQRQNLDALAEKFAKTNFDDVSVLYQESLSLFKEGKIDEALQKLESVDLIGQAEKVIKEEQRIEKAKQQINEDENSVKKQKEDILKNLSLEADIYVLRYELAKAEAIYDKILVLDSTNLGTLQKIADFYRENHLYKKALTVYPKIIVHPQAEEWQVANAYSYMGNLYTTTGNLEKALEAQTFSMESYQKMSKKNGNCFYKNGLAISYSQLGDIHRDLGNLDKALAYFEKYNQLESELYSSYPTNVGFKNGLAISYSKLGLIHNSLGNLQQVLDYFVKYNQLESELYSSYPTNVEFKNGLAISYQFLGNTHNSLGKLQQALDYFVKFNQLESELYSSYPTNVGFKNNLAISYEKLGATHSSLGNLQKALDYFEKYNQLESELYSSYPTNVEFKNLLAISYQYLGITHSSLGNLQKALDYFEKYNQLESELYSSYPTNVGFKNNLAVSYEKLGATHSSLGNLQQALEYFEVETTLFKELYLSYPASVGFKKGLAISYLYLGQIYHKMNNSTQAKKYYSESKQLYLELVRDFPQNGFQYNLQWVENQLKSLEE
jgi:tetratricopeptide (TPR) repeat protein